MKKFKFKFNNVAVIAFSIVLVILLNVTGVLLEEKFPALKLDLTESAMTKITPETKAVLEGLEEKECDIELIYLKGRQNVTKKVMDVLQQYDAYCENITSRVENFETNPLILSEYGIDPSAAVEGSVIVSTKDKQRVRIVLKSNMEVTYNQSTVFLLENLLTNAIGVVSSSDRMSVCFITGHDEKTGEMLISLLNSQNILVSQADLSTGGIDEDVDLAIIMAPGKDYTMSEINALDDYMSKGGNLAVALPFGIVNERLENYLATWGIKAENNIVLEQDKNLSYQETGMYFYSTATDYSSVAEIGNRVLNSYARSLEFEKTGDIEADVLLKSSKDSYAFPVVGTELDKENVTYGEFSLAYILEKPLDGSFENTGKLIVTSSPSVWGVSENMVTDFDYHVFYSLSEESLGNSAFVMNMLSDVYGKEVESIYVPLKSRKVSILTIPDSTAKILQKVFCVAIPVLVLLCGVIVWLRRRNK